VLKCGSIPSREYKFFRNIELNWGPLSEIVVTGNPCLVKMWFTNNRAVVGASGLPWHGMKCAILVNLSATFKILSYPLLSGNLTIRSYDILCHGPCGISNGISGPLATVVLVFVH
jgi:hypothetical protein